MKPRTVIQFHVTPREKRAIQRAAKRSCMTVSAWLRWSSEMQEIRVSMLRNPLEKEPAQS